MSSFSSPSVAASYSSGWVPSLGFVFRALLCARLCSVFFMHISDCDETFNYWEPFHYVIYGSGFQTWEYSPAYAVRSYSYIVLHVIPMLLTIADNKLVVFFLMRVVMGFFCVLCEFYFYRAVLERFGARIARWMFLFLVCGCGMYISSSAFLPSSFSMYFTMLALGAWFTHSYGVAIFAVTVSTIVGWPFCAALGIPIAVDLLFNRKYFIYFIIWSLFSLIVVGVPTVIVDSIYYGKLVCTPLNIVLYNVFGKGGPNLYGIEPWYFYFINGFLNFNVVFILSLLAVPLMEAQILNDVLVTSTNSRDSWFRTLYGILLGYSGRSATNSPNKDYRKAAQSMVIWILVIFTRPHKEERFLFPIYPLICLNAAIGLVLLPGVVQLVWRYLWAPRILRTTSRAVMDWLPSVTAILYITLSFSRIYALYIGYYAPTSIYRHLNSGEILTVVQPVYSDINVCVGKEWYRYPSSFYLPAPKWKLRFIRSEFKGQLPKPYGSHKNATWIIPTNMNDINKEEPSRYFDVEDCHFLVDLDLPVSSKLEPRYAQDHSTWHLVASHPFMDASRSHKFFRAFYVPYLSTMYTKYEEYVLLLNKNKFRKIVSKLTPDYPDFIK